MSALAERDLHLAQLHCAVLARDVPRVRALLPLTDVAACGSAALRYAVTVQDEALVRLLLPLSDAKVDDSAALREAARLGNLTLVHLLLPHSDARALDSRALKVAAYNGFVAVVDALIPVSRTRAPSLLPQGVRALVDPQRRRWEREALTWAAEGGQLGTLEALIPVSDCAADGFEALCGAVRYHHYAAADRLMREVGARGLRRLQQLAGQGLGDVAGALAYCAAWRARAAGAAALGAAPA